MLSLVDFEEGRCDGRCGKLSSSDDASSTLRDARMIESSVVDSALLPSRDRLVRRTSIPETSAVFCFVSEALALGVAEREETGVLRRRPLLVTRVEGSGSASDTATPLNDWDGVGMPDQLELVVMHGCGKKGDGKDLYLRVRMDVPSTSPDKIELTICWSLWSLIAQERCSTTTSLTGHGGSFSRPKRMQKKKENHS